MWIATAGSSTWVNKGHSRLAREAQAFEAFAFLNWLARELDLPLVTLQWSHGFSFLVFCYTSTLFVVAIKSHNKGHRAVWTSSVRDFDFNAAVHQHAMPAATGKVIPGPEDQQAPNAPQGPTPMMEQQRPLAPEGPYVAIGFTGPPQRVPQQSPVAMV
jgi:hypothetical protein